MSDPGLVSVRYELDDRHASTWRDEVCDRMLDAESSMSPATRLGVTFGVTAMRGVVHLDCRAREPGLAIARSASRVASSTVPPTMGLSLVTSGEATSWGRSD